MSQRRTNRHFPALRPAGAITFSEMLLHETPYRRFSDLYAISLGGSPSNEVLHGANVGMDNRRLVAAILHRGCIEANQTPESRQYSVQWLIQKHACSLLQDEMSFGENRLIMCNSWQSA
jgi:hypothetical protein